MSLRRRVQARDRATHHLIRLVLKSQFFLAFAAASACAARINRREEPVRRERTSQ